MLNPVVLTEFVFVYKETILVVVSGGKVGVAVFSAHLLLLPELGSQPGQVGLHLSIHNYQLHQRIGSSFGETKKDRTWMFVLYCLYWCVISLCWRVF